MSVFLFKQKTAYEVRISDWSSDVCSSDLRRTRCRRAAPATVSGQAAYAGPIPEDPLQRFSRCPACPSRRACGPRCDAERPRAEERRVGKEGVSTCRSRWSRDHEKKKHRQRHNHNSSVYEGYSHKHI